MDVVTPGAKKWGLGEAVVAPWKTLFFSMGSEEVLVGARVFAAAVGTSDRTELGRK